MEKEAKEKVPAEELINETMAVEEAPASQTVVEAEGVTPSGSRVKAFWSKKFPDDSFENDDEFDGRVASYLEESDARMSRFEEAEKTFRTVAKNHPELLDMVEDLADDPDMTIAEALYNNVDEEEFMPEDGSADFNRMREARKARKAREDEAAAHRKQLADNLATSEEVIRKYFEENGVSEEEQKAIGDFIDELLGGVVENRITANTMDAFRRARNYERDLAEAEEIGQIKGKNAKVDAERQRKSNETDGLPAPGSAAGVKAKAPVEKDFLDELIDRSNERNNWFR